MLSREDARIEKHIRWAEERLRAGDVSHLPLPVRRVRDRLIDALAEYRRAGRFPRNHARAALTPVFIDEHGTRCAMAHLLELVGAHSLVARVARTNNLARIPDLASDPELLMWLAAMGLTVDEAARIQPSYCFYKRAHCWCSHFDQPQDAVVTTTYLGPGDGGRGLYRVEKVHGGKGVVVGETLETSVGYMKAATVGSTQVLAVVKADVGTSAMVVPKDWFMDGSCEEIAKNIPVSTEEATAALLTTTCTANLVAKDPALGESVCTPFDGGVTTDTKGPLEAAPPDTTVVDTAGADTSVADTELPDTMLADTAAPASPDTAPEIVGATEPLPGRSCAFGHATDALVPLTLVFGAAVLAQRRWLH